MTMLPKLNEGLDVNVYFNKPDSFEFTEAIQLFDLLDISLYHGWCV